jgi:magnesium transporter
MSFHKRTPPIGSRPGTLAIPPGSPPPRIHVFDYRGEVCREADVEDPDELRPYLVSPETTWIDVQGFGDEAKLRSLAGLCGLHPLTLEAATNVPQRATSELRSEHQLIVARVPLPEAGGALEVPQVCMILARSWLLTFQDRYFGFFDPVRARLREGIGPIRHQGPDYLAYALLDALVDRYFPIVEELAEQLEDLEERVNDDPDSRTLSELHRIRRQLVVIRRIGWPQREALRSMLVEHASLITPEVKVYLRSTEQHMAQVMEAADSAKEATGGLVEIYLSNVSQKTNDIMKVLALMASIFIPLTFVAGIYGMNFESMPELSSAWGYPIVLLTMLLVAGGMILYFRRRGWIRSGWGGGGS